MKRRILMVSSVPLAKPWNGADKNLANLLVRRDRHNHFVVHTSAKEPWDPQSDVTAIRSRRVSAMPTTEQRLREIGYMLRHSGSADLIHLVASLHGPSSWTGPALRAWSTFRQRPLVHTLPSVGDVPIERRNFAGDATVVVSEHTRRRLQDHGVSNVFRVYPPLETDSLHPVHPARAEAAIREFGLGDRAILYPAHYGEDSGIREIIQAFSRLRGDLAPHEPVLVLACRSHAWQDPEAERLKILQQAAEAGISDRIRVLGHVFDMPALIRACAVTVLVPRRLNAKMDLPLVILESLALGRPVIVGDQAPISEALLGEGGFRVPYGNVPALASALARLLGSVELRQKLAEAGRASVLEHCDPENVVEHYQEIYDRVVRPASRQVCHVRDEMRSGAG
jgi:glycosyltransferase involved in cell wall biosynthesis